MGGKSVLSERRGKRFTRSAECSATHYFKSSIEVQPCANLRKKQNRFPPPIFVRPLLAALPTMSSDQEKGAVFSALSAVPPALASTACCWGPALLSIFGAASGSSSAVFSQFSKFRPHLTALSVTMISYSFYKVYGPASKQDHACCKTNAQTQKRLQMNRTVAWVSLGFVIAGVSYGRLRLPTEKGVAFFRKNMFPPVEKSVGGPVVNAAGIPPPPSLNFVVEGMHCGGCAGKVKRAVENMEGVRGVKVDYKTGSVVVDYIRGQQDAAAVESIIAKLGYSVKGSI